MREGSVMISTPGQGLAPIDWDDIWRETFTYVNSLGAAAAPHLSRLRSLLDTLPIEIDPQRIWPVIVAAGKGTRAAESGLSVPKPLALIGNEPAIVHVLDNVRAGLGQTRAPVVIGSPETEAVIRQAMLRRRYDLFSKQVLKLCGRRGRKDVALSHEFSPAVRCRIAGQPAHEVSRRIEPS